MSRQYEYGEFCSILADAITRPLDDVRACGRVMSDLSLDELSLAGLVMAVEELNPYFRLPDQIDINDLTLADVYYFYCVMTAGHVDGEVPSR